MKILFFSEFFFPIQRIVLKRRAIRRISCAALYEEEGFGCSPPRPAKLLFRAKRNEEQSFKENGRKAERTKRTMKR